MPLSKFIVVCVFMLINICAIAQYSDEYYHYKKLFPNDEVIRLNYQTEIEIKESNGEIKISSTTYEESIYLNASASHYSEQSIPFSKFYDLTEIKASTYVYDNGKYKQLKVKDFKIKDDISGSAFYDDDKSMSFIYNNLQEGSKTDLYLEEEINDPHFLKKFFIGYYWQVVKSSLKITVDECIDLDFIEFNTDSIDLSFDKYEKNGKIIYQWNSGNFEKYKPEENSRNFTATVPHIVPYIKSYESKGKRVYLLNDIQGLYNWYYELIEDVNKDKPSTELVQLTQELIKDKPSDIEKVRAIYYWVQQNIKYVAFEYGLGGFVPRNANDIFNKKYGDCKDNSSILQEMLKIAGIKSYLTWIGTRDILYTYSEVHTPAADNHMILTYISDSDTCFLDATSRHQKLELPTHFIQGKEALISIDKDKFEVIETPVIDAEESYINDSVHLNIEGQTLTGSGSITVDGYYKISFYSLLETEKSATDLKEFYNLNLQKGNNKFLISDFNEYNKFDYDKEFKVDYSFKIDDYIHTADNEMYINLNLSKHVLKYKIKKEDKLDKDYKFKNYSEFVYILTIPNGYDIEYIPKNITYNNPKFSTSISYTNKGNQLIYKHKIKMNYLTLKQYEFDDFNSFIEILDKSYKESIVLKRNN